MLEFGDRQLLSLTSHQLKNCLMCDDIHGATRSPVPQLQPGENKVTGTQRAINAGNRTNQGIVLIYRQENHIIQGKLFVHINEAFGKFSSGIRVANQKSAELENMSTTLFLCQSRKPQYMSHILRELCELRLDFHELFEYRIQKSFSKKL